MVSLTSLKHTYLSCNHINTIDYDEDDLDLSKPKPNVFSQLETLDLSFNSITNLSNNVFTRRISLKELCLNYNKIESIDRDAFSGIENLKILRLIENKLTKLCDYTFKNISSLEELNLMSNQLVQLDKQHVCRTRQAKNSRSQ